MTRTPKLRSAKALPCYRPLLEVLEDRLLPIITDPNMVFSVPYIDRPGYLQAFADPVFGTTVTRIAGDPGTALTASDGTTGLWSRDARHMYVSDQPWNSDGSLIAIENRTDDGGSPYELFLNGNTYQVAYTQPSNLPYGGGGEERWNYLPGHANERIVAGWPGDTLYWFDVVNNIVTRSWNLPVSVQGIGMGKGNTSRDGRFLALSDSSGRMFVIDMDPQAPYAPYPDQRSGPIYDLSSDGAMQDGWSVDSVSISPSGQYVLVEYSFGSGDAERVFDVNPITLALTPHPMSVSWHGQAGNAAQGFIYSIGHGDLTLNPFNDNADVMVGQEESGNRGTNIAGIRTVNDDGIGGVVMVQLSNNAVTSLTDPGNGGSIAAEAYVDHVSAQDTTRPGWIYVTYYNEEGKRYADEVIAVELDGSGSVERHAHYHSDFDNYDLSQAAEDSDFGYRSEGQAVPSPDGTHLIFASNWLYQGKGSGIQDYLIDARRLGAAAFPPAQPRTPLISAASSSEIEPTRTVDFTKASRLPIKPSSRDIALAQISTARGTEISRVGPMLLIDRDFVFPEPSLSPLSLPTIIPQPLNPEESLKSD